jgi:predicted small lipoprotein YifL
MIATDSQHFSALLARLLAVAILASGIAGCGLKGDLYIEEPRTEQSTPPTADVSDTQNSGKEPEGMTPEFPAANDELVNSEAAGSADPARSVMGRGDFGGETTEQLDSEVEMGTGQSVGISQPVTTIELQDPGNDSEDTADKSSELTESPATPETASENDDSQAPANEAIEAVTPAP